MAIPSQPTTAISLGPTNTPTQRSISNEFSDTAPHQLDQFRRAPGGSIPENPANAGIPTLSGQSISFSQFNGATSSPGSTVVNYDVTASNTDFDLLRFATSPNRPVPTRYVAGTPGWQITFRIANNVLISSSSWAKSYEFGALTTNTSGPTRWHPDVTLTINNQGAIVGAGGHGGRGVTSTPPNPIASTNVLGHSGESGGIAINAQRPITIFNNPNPWARIAGGGGGGAGGGGIYSYISPTPVSPAPPLTFSVTGGNGGGGAGRLAGKGGGPNGGAPGFGTPASDQTIPAGVSSPGAASQGEGAPPVHIPKGLSGVGGALGGSGGRSPWPQIGPNQVVARAGFYAVGAPLITWTSTGTRQGNTAPTWSAPPTSGAPGIGNPALTVIQYQFTSPANNVNLAAYATSPARPVPTRYTAGQPGYRLEFTIGPGALISSPQSTTSAIEVGNNSPGISSPTLSGHLGYHPDVEVVIINQGRIHGAGGPGGWGGAPAPQIGQAGLSGGTAINAGRPVIIQNQGTIAGGGGGGGGSGGYPTGVPIPLRPGGGGGGGAGRQPGSFGQGQPGSAPSQGQAATAQPVPGGVSAAGNGGTTTETGFPAPIAPQTVPVSGGNGGPIGAAGQPGQTNPMPAPLGGPKAGGAGGAAGYYAFSQGASTPLAPGLPDNALAVAKIIWQEVGTRQGQGPF